MKRSYRSSDFIDRLLFYKLVKGFIPKVIYDGGAHRGGWSLKVSYVYPEAKYFLIEPNKTILESPEKKLIENNIKFDVINVALGNANAEVKFNTFSNSLASSLLKPKTNPSFNTTIDAEMKTIDTLVFDEKYPAPDLLKLDLQGAELNALKGCHNTLKLINMIVVEFSCSENYIGRTTPLELLNFMVENKFKLIDIVDIIYDHSANFIGGDFIFLNKKKNK